MKPEYEKLLDMMDEVYEKELEMKMDAEHDTDAQQQLVGGRQPGKSSRAFLSGMRAKLAEYQRATNHTDEYGVIETFLDWVEATR